MSTATTYTGAVTTVRNEGYGFIAMPDSADVFFHRTGLDPSLEFDETLIERRVQFGIIIGAKGQKAVNVRAAD